MLRQLQDPNKEFQEPFVPVVSAVEAGGTLRHVHNYDIAGQI